MGLAERITPNFCPDLDGPEALRQPILEFFFILNWTFLGFDLIGQL